MQENDQDESKSLINIESNRNFNNEIDNISLNSGKRLTIGENRITNYAQKKKKKKIVPAETIHQFILSLTILFIIVTTQVIIPQIVIIFTKNKINYISFFNKSYWVIIILLVIIITISLIVYFLKMEFIHKGANLAIPLFLLYLLTLTLAVTIIAFYSVYLALGVCIIQLAAFATKAILELIECMRSKIHIQLIILSIVVFIGFILYCVIVREEIVGCFIYLIFLMIFCTYATFEFKNMIIEFCDKYRLDYQKDINISIYALSLMNANVDVITCCFK